MDKSVTSIATLDDPTELLSITRVQLSQEMYLFCKLSLYGLLIYLRRVQMACAY